MHTFHISLNVTDLERAVAFYRAVFGSEPARHEPDYAKFEVVDPPLVLALEPHPTGGAGVLNHVGVRVAGNDEVLAMRDRLVAAGLDAQFIAGVECCYSRQTKVCTWDPDGTLWEFYVLDDDGAHATDATTAPLLERTAARADTNGSPALVLDHLLGAPFPGPADRPPIGRAGEVRLRGTLNAPIDAQEERALLDTAFATLRPGGRLTVHMLVGDRLASRPLPRLPGPAARVERVPVARDVLRAIEAAGFIGVSCTRYSHSPVYRFDGVEMRELMLTAWKRDLTVPNEAQPVVVYKGPFRSITDDDGVEYRRGEHVAVTPDGFAALRHSALAEHFVFVTTDASCEADGCTPTA